MTKSLRPQDVSRSLSKALEGSGVRRSYAETTSIRGWYRYTAGFEVFGSREAWEQGLTQKRDEPVVFVAAQSLDDSDRYAGLPTTERRDQILAACAQALTDLGYAFGRVDGPGRPFLRVTGKEAR